jgi:hypothetical protein
MIELSHQEEYRRAETACERSKTEDERHCSRFAGRHRPLYRTWQYPVRRGGGMDAWHPIAVDDVWAHDVDSHRSCTVIRRVEARKRTEPFFALVRVDVHSSADALASVPITSPPPYDSLAHRFAVRSVRTSNRNKRIPGPFEGPGARCTGPGSGRGGKGRSLGQAQDERGAGLAPRCRPGGC